MSKPLMSLITVVKNGVGSLQSTIDSITSQTFRDFEYIIIDGCSTDGTMQLIKENSDRISLWVSEPDKGIFDAMQKGISLSRGKWLNFINCGDSFYQPSTLEDIVPYLEETYTLIYGNHNKDAKLVVPPPIRETFYLDLPPCHQAMFFNKGFLGEDLYYDLQFSLIADYELTDRIFAKYPSRIKHIDQTVCIYASGGVSSKFLWRKRIERLRLILTRYGILGVGKSLWRKFIQLVS